MKERPRAIDPCQPHALIQLLLFFFLAQVSDRSARFHVAPRSRSQLHRLRFADPGGVGLLFGGAAARAHDVDGCED